jgi:hypothetical protein
MPAHLDFWDCINDDHDEAMQTLCNDAVLAFEICTVETGKISLQKMFHHNFLTSQKLHNNTLFEDVWMIMIIVMVNFMFKFFVYQAFI